MVVNQAGNTYEIALHTSQAELRPRRRGAAASPEQLDVGVTACFS